MSQNRNSARAAIFVLAAAVSMAGPTATAASCGLFASPDALPSGDPWLHDVNQKVAGFVAPMQVDIDGAPNAYHPCGANYPDKVCGENFGLDHICSGVTVRDADGKIVPRWVRPPGAAKPNSRLCLEAFRAAEAAGFPACGRGQPCVTQWPAIALEKGKPLKWSKGPYQGYYVSLTKLTRPDSAVPGGERAIDARRIPYVVVPGNTVLTGSWGFGSTNKADLALVIAPDRKGTARAAFAVVGDTGPHNALGEGSVELLRELTNPSSRELTYSKVTRRAFEKPG